MSFRGSLLPGAAVVIVLDPESPRVQVLAIGHQVPPILLDLVFLVVPYVLFALGAEIVLGVLADLTGIKGFVGKQKDVRVVLLLALEELPEVHGACDEERIDSINPHPIDVPIPSNSDQVFVLRNVAKEAHTL